ncbi:MAG TPA: hypothetical protein VGM08_03695 [Candidatus Saccharimonadales bacterium]
MTGLQITTDVVAIVCMSVITITWLVFLVLAITLRRKANRLFDSAEEVIRSVRNIPFIGRRLFGALKRR